jgi:hypothetical protein
VSTRLKTEGSGSALSTDGYTSPLGDTAYYSIGGYRLNAEAEQKRDGWKARSDSEPWRIADPIDWDANRPEDPNWYSQLHGWRPMDPHLQAYHRTGDGAHLRYIIPWAVSWPEYRERAPQQRWKALNALAGMRATRLGLVLDAYRRGDVELTGREQATLLVLAREFAANLMAQGGIQSMNHGYYQIMGLELLSRVLPEERWAKDALIRVAQAFEGLVSAQFTDEGVHVENSPVYHWYAVDQMTRSGALERLASPRIEDLVTKARASVPWLTFPDGGVADIGDSAGPGRPFVDAGENTVDLGKGKYCVAPFWRSGYGIVRSLPDVPPPEASMLLLVGTSHSHTHSHADKLSFELYEFGRRLIVDTGKYGYRRDPMRSYIESAIAHNTVGLEDHPIKRTEVMLGGTSLFEPVVQDDAVVLSGKIEWDTKQYAFTHRREMTYRPGESLIVADSLSSVDPRWYVSRLHFDRSLDVRQDAPSRLRADLGDGRVMEVTTNGGEITLHRGETDPVKGWQSVGYLQAEPATMAEVSGPGRESVIVWRITLT